MRLLKPKTKTQRQPGGVRYLCLKRWFCSNWKMRDLGRNVLYVVLLHTRSRQPPTVTTKSPTHINNRRNLVWHNYIEPERSKPR
ncbi:hypothetical protein AND_009507 [Anopheles darlingi]|uniref:Uncharacterized protein n=1 Tax=Anopheles darlingi TaxID=43151 RepID=W5J831_ANODA|nr:hypothetical protein AND_009507 [Anopheles darlingi]